MSIPEQEAIARMEYIARNVADQEEAHGAADSVLLACVSDDVALAYERVIQACGGFWYA